MKGPRHRPAVIVPSLGRHRDEQSADVIVHRSHVFRWKEIRGGDASLYTLYELEDEERPMEDEEEYEDHDGVEYAYDDDDEYEYYEVDHDESTEKTRDSRVMSLSKRINIAMPMQAISSKLATMHQRLMTNNNVPTISLGPITKFLSLPPHLVSSSAVVVIGTTTLSLLSLWILRTMMLHKSWRVDKLMFRNGRKRLVGGGGRRKNGRKDKKKKQNNNNKNKNEKKYGDYSTGYPMENGEEGEDVVDLDIKSVGKRERGSYWNALKQNALIPFNTTTYWMESVKLYMTSRVGKMGSWSIGNALVFFSKAKKRLDAKAGTIGNGNVDNNFESMAKHDDARPSPASTEEEVKDATRTLQHQLDALAEEHESLEQEYEASLRMLHEARMELRQLKSKRSNGNDDDRDDAQGEENQKQIMESTIQKLEQKYKQQMKEQMERFREQTEQRLRMELTQEYESALQSQSEQMAQQLQQQREEYLSSPSFQQLVDEASSIQIQEAVAQAVQDTIRQQQLQSREEMMRVREAIQKVLERERRMMKEQVAKATSQVREWVKRQQVEQLQRREEQLVVEARELGLLEEEEEEVGVEEEEGERVGDSFVSSRRDRDGRYVAGSSFRDERRRWEARDGSMGRDENDVEEIPYRGDYYSDQSNEYNEYKDENGEDDGTAGEMGQDLPDPRAQSPRRGQPRNVYREAAKRKQRRREEGL